MPRPRPVLLFASLAISFHLIAITIAAIPPPTRSPLTHQPRLDGDPIAAILQVPLTSVATGLNSLQRVFWQWTSWIRPWSGTYVAAGLRQNWNMFASVLSVQRFVRLDYYVRSPDHSQVQVFPYLILPSQDDDTPRLTFDSLDKAVRETLESFLATLRERPQRPQAGAASLAPLLRLFTSRFAADREIARDDILRTEVWVGAAPIPPPGAPADRLAADRRQVLAEYRRGAPHVVTGPYPPPDTTRQEADLTWQLVYLTQRR